MMNEGKPTMFCTACGKEMKDQEKFCSECGKGTQYASPPPRRERLTRDMADKKIAGVCAGIARQYDWDVTLVRIAFLLGVVFSGVGLILYIIAWIAMPIDSPMGASVPNRA